MDFIAELVCMRNVNMFVLYFYLFLLVYTSPETTHYIAEYSFSWKHKPLICAYNVNLSHDNVNTIYGNSVSSTH
jgi:multisubunit Na+/H+ antiporter MnhE subunit